MNLLELNIATQNTILLFREARGTGLYIFRPYLEGGSAVNNIMFQGYEGGLSVPTLPRGQRWHPTAQHTDLSHSMLQLQVPNILRGTVFFYATATGTYLIYYEIQYSMLQLQVPT